MKGEENGGDVSVESGFISRGGNTASWTCVVAIVQTPVNMVRADTKWTPGQRGRSSGGGGVHIRDQGEAEMGKCRRNKRKSGILESFKDAHRLPADLQTHISSHCDAWEVCASVSVCFPRRQTEARAV